MSKQSKMRDWIQLVGDVNWADYGCSWARKLRDGVWILLRFENMQDCCGDDAPYQYSCDVLQIDLNTLPDSVLQGALDCCDGDLDEIASEDHELVKVEHCLSYGCYAPLDTVTGDSYPERVRASARRIADTYFVDQHALNMRLNRPVNALGSTAREFGQGDIMVGLKRMHEPPAQEKRVKQRNLTGECMAVQIWGTNACNTCEYIDTEECGGKQIRESGKNKKGIKIGKEGFEEDLLRPLSKQEEGACCEEEHD